LTTSSIGGVNTESLILRNKKLRKTQKTAILYITRLMNWRMMRTPKLWRGVTTKVRYERCLKTAGNSGLIIPSLIPLRRGVSKKGNC